MYAMNAKLIHLTDENQLHIGHSELLTALEKCNQYGDIFIQDRQGDIFKIHSVQQDDLLNTVLVIEPAFDPDDLDWKE